jgi:hypothetical protein
MIRRCNTQQSKPAHGAYDWRQMADAFKPTDQAGIAAAIRQLAAQGLKVHDIAASLHIGVAAVEQALDAATSLTGETR